MKKIAKKKSKRSNFKWVKITSRSYGALLKGTKVYYEGEKPKGLRDDGAFIQAKILLIQQGYIKAIEKMNISIGKTKFPDFSLVTHDNYLDILEIKKPDTPILRLDNSRDNYYWDPEMAKAISQLENYLENISKFASDVRSHILDTYKIDLKVVRPRGIILAGDTRKFTEQKQKDDFRLLSHGLKHITVLTYDELHVRLENYISVLKQYDKQKKPKTTQKKRK